MDATTAANLNRYAILLNYLAFFLALPELLGEKRMGKLMAGLSGWSRSLLIVALILIVPIFIFAFILTAINAKTLQSGNLETVITTANGIITIPLSRNVLTAGYWLIAIALGIYLGFKQHTFTQQALMRFADDEKRHRFLLWLAAGLFTIATVLQFLATYSA